MRSALHVVHVHPAACAFECGELRHQHPCEPRHTLLVVPGFVLRLGGVVLLHQVLRQTHLVDADNLFAKLARLAFLGQQGITDACGVGQRHGHFQFTSFGGEGLGAGLPQRAGCGQQLGTGCVGHQPGSGCGVACECGELHIPGLHRCVDHTGFIGECELHTARQGTRQRLVGLCAAMGGHHGVVVGLQARIGQHGRIKRQPNLGNGFGVVLQQFVVRGQSHVLQHGQRGGAQQCGKPAVEGADLHRAASGQQIFLQTL